MAFSQVNVNQLINTVKKHNTSCYILLYLTSQSIGFDNFLLVYKRKHEHNILKASAGTLVDFMPECCYTKKSKHNDNKTTSWERYK